MSNFLGVMNFDVWVKSEVGDFYENVGGLERFFCVNVCLVLI